MQVYRGMDVGTAKPSAAVRREVPHRMVDIVEPEEGYSVAEFQRDARVAVAEAMRVGRPVVIVGGSGLHFRAVVDPLEFPPTDAALRAELESVAPGDLVAELVGADPEAGRHVDLANRRRVQRAVEVLRLTSRTPSARAETPAARAVHRYEPSLPFLAIGLDPGSGLERRVERRFDRMLDRGLLGEVVDLEPRLGPTARQAVGYKELLAHVRGDTELEAARRDAIRATLGLAKRQRTFFGRDGRIRWLSWQDDPAGRIEAVVASARELQWIS